LYDDRQVAAYRLKTLEKFKAVHARHVQIENDQLDGAAGLTLQDIEPARAAIDRNRIAAESADQFFEDAALCWIVFDNENANGHARRTSSQVDVVIR